MTNCMNIDTTKPGAKVKFSNPNAGYPHHRKVCGEHLKIDQMYTLQDIKVHNWHTDIYLEEVPGVRFNSVMFSEA